MSDYWKSLPRKFCDICKCWFADNRASIEFHEKGKNHQENVKKRINQIQKKGLKDFKAKKKLDDQMEKIEKAALEAFKKDLQQNPKLAEKYNINIDKTEIRGSTSIATPVKTENNSRTDYMKNLPISDVDAEPEKIWYEAVTDEGYTYYWNNITSESQWESPKEGYVPLKEQNEENAAVENSESEVSIKGEVESPESSEDSFSNAIGPQPKPDPYGSWVPVEKKVEEVIDWQLPPKTEIGVEIHIPLVKEDSFKIKEKTVGHLSKEFGTGESTFKKRKNLGSAKRNVRQRVAEDG